MQTSCRKVRATGSPQSSPAGQSRSEHQEDDQGRSLCSFAIVELAIVLALGLSERLADIKLQRVPAGADVPDLLLRAALPAQR